MDRKWTHVIFALGGLVLAWLLSKTGEWIWSYWGRPNQLLVGLAALVVAGLVTFVAWKNERVFEVVTEVTTELSKVSWPSRKETVSSTIIVIITTIVASIILGVFDATWSWVTRMIYG